jgi:hypothetical protein
MNCGFRIGRNCPFQKKNHNCGCRPQFICREEKQNEHIFVKFLNNFFFCSASKFGVKKLLPAYLDPNLQIEDLLTGVSFASGGAGYDPLTSQLAVNNYV